MTEARSALLIGATGLIGGHCLDVLLESPDYASVTALVRRPLGRQHPKLLERVVDFAVLDEVGVDLRIDDVFGCLGTTIKTAGSKERFRWVDYDCTINVATLARKAGASRIAIVSSVGADAGASSFYMRVKGETERDISALGYETVELFRPSLLVGDRKESRPGEAVAIAVMRPLGLAMFGPLKAYRPIEAKLVAAAMVKALLQGEPGTHLRFYDDIIALGS